MRKSKTIDIEKKYIFPSNLKIVEFKKKTLVISPNTASWIVLDNHKQLEFFKLLKTSIIKNALMIFDGELSDAQNVLIQIEAKKFTKLENNIQILEENEIPHIFILQTVVIYAVLIVICLLGRKVMMNLILKRFLNF